MRHILRQRFPGLLTLIWLFSLFLIPVSAQDVSVVCPEYEALFPGPDTVEILEDTLSAADTIPDTVLNGKSIMFFGDSLLAGYKLNNYSQSWCGMLETKYGMKVTCKAISGSTFGVSSTWGYKPGGYYYPFCKRELPEGDFDVIFVAGSGNDWKCEIPLGTDLTSRDTYTLIGAMNVVIDRLQEAYPNALLLFSTSWNSTGKANGLGLTTADYNNTFIKVCQARNILCFQACDPAISGIDASSTSFRSSYFLTSTDFWHLNVTGHQRYLPTIASWIEKMMLENYVISGFYDVTPGDWYATAVKYAYESGLTKGTSDTTFSPDQTMTRCMLVTVLYRAAGHPDVTNLTHPFEDIPENAYYKDALLWAYESGLTIGIDDTHFAPDSALTREQLATFLYRYAQAEGTDYLPDDLSAFTDQDQISDFARPAIAWAVGSDILHGMGNGILAPRGTATRAQMVTLLANYLSIITEP